MSDVGTTAVRAINISEVLRGMGRRWKMLAAFTLGFAALGLLFILTAKPLYTSEAQILIEYQDSPYTRPPVAGTQQPRQIAESDVRSQVAVLKSRDLALKVLKRLKLIGTPEFDSLKKGVGPVRKLKVLLGFASDPRKQTPEQRALETWYKSLRVYSVPRTKIIVIEFDSPDPQIAAAVANTLAEVYVEQTRNSQLEQTSEARQWLKDQIEKLRKKVVESEVAVERFRAEAGLLRGARSTLYSQRLSELNSQLVRAQAERSQAQARARAIREMLKKGSIETSAEVLRSPLIQRLREQQVRLQRRLAELSTVYLDNHPKVRAVRQELNDLDKQLRAEARKVAASLEQQAKIAAEREAELRAALGRLKEKASDASVNEVKLRELEREAKANRALLESFLARYTDATARDEAAALPGMARIISRADVPSLPSFPRKGPVMFLSTLAGLMLGLGIAFIIEVMAASSRLAKARSGSSAAGGAGGSREGAASADPVPGARGDDRPFPSSSDEGRADPRTVIDRIESEFAGLASGRRGARKRGHRKDGRRAAEGEDEGSGGAAGGLAGGAVVPALSSRDEAAALAMAPVADGDGPYSRMLAPAVDWLERHMSEGGKRRLLVVAREGLCADAAAGAVALARIESARGRRVVVLDADPEGRCLPLVTGMKDVPGVYDLLAERAGFADVVRRDTMSATHFIHAGGRGTDAVLSGEGLRTVLEALARTYDLVVLLGGEGGTTRDALSAACELAIVVAREDDARDVAAEVEALRRNGVAETFLLMVGAGGESAGGRHGGAAGRRKSAAAM